MSKTLVEEEMEWCFRAALRIYERVTDKEIIRNLEITAVTNMAVAMFNSGRLPR